MRYIEQVISGDEKVLFEARTHWAVYIWPVILILFYGIGLIFILTTWIYTKSTDLAVTNKRVIGKWGLISRNTIEQRLDKVDTVQIQQGLLGRILGYGSLRVTGSGGLGVPVPWIADPLSFRKAVNDAIDSRDLLKQKD
jgi:uncharacterized membrane protein YdbT with pleckstrin-like domain